ncbi:DDE-type integrase/transposase/recombinase [Acidisphaera sp. S103]|uniref:DDE-type integrase/transposase/recombinase n=1 Tax=Acidisphaera sp. S103 TaxID=1747223 RepID=UPI001C203B02
MPRVTRPYIKVHGHWRYLYRAIDRSGALVDVMFSEHRDMACRFQSIAATCYDLIAARLPI